jgi:hypothetical protein
VLGDDIVARGGAGGDDHGEFVGVLDLVHMRVILYPDGAESLSMEDAVPSVVYLSNCRGHVAGGVAVGCGSGDGAGRRVAHANDDARAVILTGARGSFCSGLDLRDGEDDVGGGGGGGPRGADHVRQPRGAFPG